MTSSRTPTWVAVTSSNVGHRCRRWYRWWVSQSQIPIRVAVTSSNVGHDVKCKRTILSWNTGLRNLKMRSAMFFFFMEMSKEKHGNSELTPTLWWHPWVWRTATVNGTTSYARVISKSGLLGYFISDFSTYSSGKNLCEEWCRFKVGLNNKNISKNATTAADMHADLILPQDASPQAWSM